VEELAPRIETAVQAQTRPDIAAGRVEKRIAHEDHELAVSPRLPRDECAVVAGEHARSIEHDHAKQWLEKDRTQIDERLRRARKARTRERDAARQPGRRIHPQVRAAIGPWRPYGERPGGGLHCLWGTGPPRGQGGLPIRAGRGHGWRWRPH